MSGKKYKVLSLFSGCGGMDIGFEGSFTCLKKAVNTAMHPDWVETEYSDGIWVKLAPTQFKTVFANDIRPDAKAAWSNYFKDKADAYHLGSVVELVKQHKAGEKILPEGVAVVTGGFPCQDFSVAGKRQGFDSRKSHTGKAAKDDAPSAENRGNLYMWMREVVALTSPLVFVAENVKGLTTLADAKVRIERDFSEAGDGGYLVVPARVLYAPDYGVPQSRERVIFLGFRKNALKKEAIEALSAPVIPDEYDPYPPKTHFDGGNPAYVTARDAFVGLPEPDEADDLSQRRYSKAKYMGRHCQGQSEVKLDYVGPTIRSEHHGNIEYRRLSREHGGVYVDELAAGLKERRLTVRECARLQTFPDDYQFVLPSKDGNTGVSASDAYKIIGNAVPCVLAYNLAKNLEAKIPLYFGGQP